MTFRLFALVMTVLIFSMPCVVLSQQTNDAAQAIAQAKNDVKEPFVWLAGSFLTSVALGCLGGSVVIATSLVIPAEAPTYRLLGKSPDYVNAYVNTYKKEVKQKRLIHTSTGCVAGYAVFAWMYKVPPFFSTKN